MQTRSNPSPFVTNTSNTILTVRVQFDKFISHGDTADTDAWLPMRGTIPLSVNSVNILLGRIFIAYTSLIGPATSIGFVGPPPIFRNIDGAILESFVSPVPFP